MIRQQTINNPKAQNEFGPQTKEELLALDIATGIEDLGNIPLYIFLCKKYPESLLRRALGQAKEVPQQKIKKSRAAIFFYLLKKYVSQNNHHPGNKSGD